MLNGVVCNSVGFLLHLLLGVGEKGQIIGKVIQLIPECLLDAILLLRGGGLHHPVYGQQEQEK